MGLNRIRSYAAAGLLALGLAVVAACQSATGPSFPKVLVIGDSMALGMGAGSAGPNCQLTMEQTARPYLAYGALVANAYAAELVVEAAPGLGLVRNFEGQAGATLQERLGYPKYRTLSLKTEAPSVVILHIGTNDFQNFDAGEAFEEAYADLAAHLLAAYPRTELVAMIGPMLQDSERALAASRIQAALASLPEADADRVHFLHIQPDELGEGWVGCQWRPTVAAHRKMADRILAALQEN